MKLEFSRQVFEKYSNIKSCENRSQRADLFHAGGGTDMTKVTVAFHNFTKVSKIFKVLLWKGTNACPLYRRETQLMSLAKI